MKNQIIKKMMAYLLVGAMVISTPISASATELENAYNYNPETGEYDTSSGTGTSTASGTKAVEIPKDVIEKVPQILGISVEPTALEFDAPDKTKPVQARVIFDDYDSSKEDMQWAAITAEEKAKIEEQIHWFSDDYKVASFATNGVNDTKTGSKAVVKSVAGGETTVYAWIEADGKAWTDKWGNILDRPTDGDFIAEVSVSVKNTVKSITFDAGNTKFAKGKRLYDLKKYTVLEYTDGTKELASASNVNLTYSISDPKALKDNKVTATVTDAGSLKISKGDAGKVIDVDIVSEDGTHGSAKITLVAPNPITKMGKFDPARGNLDLGFKEQRTLDLTCPSTTPALKDTTDELVWSSNKPAIATVSASGEYGEEATITAVGVGTAKITVKASSGKSAAFTVTVFASPKTVEITGADSGYTGKPITLNAVLKAEDGMVLPVGNTSLKWAKGNNKDKNIKKVSGKKDVATVTPADLLTDLNGVTSTVTVGGSYKNASGKQTLNTETHTISLTQSDVKNVTIDIFQKTKSNDKDVVYDTMYTIPKKAKETAKNENVTVTYNGLKDLKNNKKAFYVGQNYFMDAEGDGQIDSIAWAVTGKNVNYNAYDEHLTADFTGTAKTTVKASYITVDRTKPDKPKAIKNTKTINITPIQNATSIAFAKPVVVKNPAKKTDKPQSVSFAIKNIVPKKANYGKVEWKVMAYDGEKTYVQNTTMTGAEKATLIKKFNEKSVTINVPDSFKAGSVVKVGAYTQAGVVAYGYIYITEQTTKVIPQASKNGAEFKEAGTKKNVNTQSMKLGSTDTLKLSAKLETKYFENGAAVTMKGNDARDAALGATKLGDPVYGTTTAYQAEPVTFTLDKKSALIIKVDEDGNVTPLKKGTATVTIKTLSNKSGKVTVIVE